MRKPVEGLKSPIVDYIVWFENKSSLKIIEANDDKFKSQLKYNSLKIINIANKSFHEKIDAWSYISPHRQAFGPFFKAVIRLALSKTNEFNLTIDERYKILTFFNYAFNSIEVDFVHEQIRKYLPLSIWVNLSDARKQMELSKLSKRIRLAWKKLMEQDKALDEESRIERNFERSFIFNYLQQFLVILQEAVDDPPESFDGEKPPAPPVNRELALFCQRFLEFVIDIESQLPLRRFFHALLEYTHFVVKCQLSSLARCRSPEGYLFAQLIELLQLYSRYEIDLMTGEPLSDVDVIRKHEEDIQDLQRLLWEKYENLRKFAIKPVKAIDNRKALYEIITSFDRREDFFAFLKTVGLADEHSLDSDDRLDASLMAEILMNRYRRFDSHLKKINSIPMFPNESVIWDTNLVPDEYYNYEFPLALPKLNLQFLTMSDYLLRNFMLFKNESTYEIRQDIEEAIRLSKCRWTAEGHFATGPKQRMALIIKSFSIIEIGKPKLGEACPSNVRARVDINMDYVRPEWRREWEQLRRHDTCFLISFKNSKEKDVMGWPEATFPGKHGLKYVRGCEIESLLDSEGKIVDENLECPKFADNLRTFIVSFDCNQYKMDQDGFNAKGLAVYDKFHLMVRRKPEKNNFKGVLETIRSLINTKFVVPEWLRDLIIGFGDPRSAHYSNLVNPGNELEIDYFDTFIDKEHLISTFEHSKPNYSLKFEHDGDTILPFVRVRYNENQREIFIKHYDIPSRGPYPVELPKKSTIRFTPAQLDAITSGLMPGLTMIVGPPGTGKTDVAVQILNALYHAHPSQRTLIVTHSNQALNQIFEKMIELDVKEHHLLRMGHGEEDLQSDKDFSRQGRVRHVLFKRTELLGKLRKLAKSLGLEPGDELSCQSSQYFYSYHIGPRWMTYEKTLLETSDVKKLEAEFPFLNFFQDAPQPLFKHRSIEEDREIANSCFRYIRQIFDDLKTFRPFEIFNSPTDRSQYLLIREAKVIAMTCTHAGLKRKELVDMNFQYDNILMEETAQILEIETAIPLLLQNPENGINRLKRWIMIGDHNQLPPIIQNSAFQKFSNMEQSLFARFVRLGVPTIELDAQGRARKSLCDLYRWRYKNLKELDHIFQRDEYKRANAGFLYEYQLVNIDDYKGHGESTPMPYFYQNRGEAEFVVALYKYMRMIGYPSEKITILTTYNGQKQLIKDMVDKECSRDGFMGQPSKVTTVDKFQGQQNDYILLSLVRTRNIGHIRDVRRLVVAMSRARLGLYVCARVGLFQGTFELQLAMKQFLAQPQTLCLITNEKYPSHRAPSDMAPEERLESAKVERIKSVEEMQQLVERLYDRFMEERARETSCMDDSPSSEGD